MQPAPIPPNEDERLKTLLEMKILDTKPDVRLDRLTEMAIKEFDVPISTVSIIDKDREWFKSCQGVAENQGSRANSFCGHAMLADQIFIVEDTKEDPRFKDNPAVVGKPFVRFYAGVVLNNQKHHLPIGVFCIKDTKPRKFSARDINRLIELATQAESILNG